MTSTDININKINMNSAFKYSLSSCAVRAVIRKDINVVATMMGLMTND